MLPFAWGPKSPAQLQASAASADSGASCPMKHCSGCLSTDLLFCVHRVVDGIEDGCGSDQPKFSFRVRRSGPECSSSPSPGPGTGARVRGEVGRAASLPWEPLRKWQGTDFGCPLALTHLHGLGRAVGKTSTLVLEGSWNGAW